MPESVETNNGLTTFNEEALVVAELMKGMGVELESQDGNFTILDTKAFPEKEIKRREFKEAQILVLGSFSGIKYRGNQRTGPLALTNITVANRGLAMITSIRNNTTGEVITNHPALVSRALGIKAGDLGKAIIDDISGKLVLFFVKKN